MSETRLVSDRADAVRTVQKALTFFRVMAVIAGVALLILCLEMFLKYGLDNEALSWWSPVHGLLFIGFVVSVYNLGTKMGWSFQRMIGYVLTAFVPILSFWLEHKVTRDVRARLAQVASVESAG